MSDSAPDFFPDRRYLGDGAYARLDRHGSIILNTSDGYRDTNTIVLEPEVLQELERFIAQLRANSVIAAKPVTP